MGVVKTIDTNGAGTLTKPWEGPDLIGVNYRMRYQPDGARMAAQARQLIEILGNGNLVAFAGLTGSANKIPVFTAAGAMDLISKSDLVSGANFDVQVANLSARAAYDGQAAGFSVLVSDVGDGRAAIYTKVSATSGDWSAPAYVTGPIGIPIIAAGTTTTLPSGSDATFEVVPSGGGYVLNAGIPRGLQGTPGVAGPTGEGLKIDAAGPFSDRSSYNSQPQGFVFFATDGGSTGGIYIRSTSTSGVWAGPYEFTQGPPGDDGALITTTNGVGDGTPGPYTLNATPLNPESVWVTYQGVTQYEYTIVSDQITFGDNLKIGEKWQVKTSGPLPIPVGDIPNETITAPMLRASELTAIRTRIGAGTGNGNVSNANTAVDLRVAVFDGNGQTIKDGGKTIAELVPFGYDNLMLTTSILAMQVADNSNLAVFGPNWLADSFDALTYVDVAGATNLDSSVTGLLKATGNWGGATFVMHADGVNGSTSFPDAIGSVVMTAFNGATVTTSFQKFGTGSALFPSTSYLLGDGSAGFTFGTGDFTIDFWIRPGTIAAQYIYDGRTASSQVVPLIRMTASGGLDYFVNGSVTITGATAMSAGTWYHVALARASGVTKLFLNGVQQGSSYTDANNYIGNANRPAICTVGDAPGNSAGFIGCLDELRVCKGTALWSANFTPPVSAAAVMASNLTVRSTALTALTAPTKAKATLRVKEVDAAVAGTDYTLEYTRDNGTTWTLATLTELFTSPSPVAGIRVVSAVETDISAQPTGTNVRWRFKTLNNKNVEFHDIYLEWN